MVELTLVSNGNTPIRNVVEAALKNEYQELLLGIQKPKSVGAFEEKYKMVTDEFLKRYAENEFQHSFDFDEWIGESRMLTHLTQKPKRCGASKLLIDEYFGQVDALLAASEIVQHVEANYDRRDKSTGFIRANITFVDNSILHVREFVNVMVDLDRLMYSYQYMSADKSLIFRYDDADHHQKLNLSTFPHHKHDGSEENIAESSAPTLADVLAEIGFLSSRGDVG